MAELAALGFVTGYVGAARNQTDGYAGDVLVFNSASSAADYVTWILENGLEAEPGTVSQFAVPEVTGAHGVAYTQVPLPQFGVPKSLLAHSVVFSVGRVMVWVGIGGPGSGQALSIQSAQLVAHRLMG